MIIIPMPSQVSKVQSATTYKCHNSSCGDLLKIFGGLKIFELKLANWMIMS
jgi:hypothetical protein